MEAFAKKGYSVLHVIPGYNYDWFDRVAYEAERLGLWIMYDMRGTFRDDRKVREQVERYKRRKNLLLWYTADEPGVYTTQGLKEDSHDHVDAIQMEKLIQSTCQRGPMI